MSNTIRRMASSGPSANTDWRSALPFRKSSDPIPIIGTSPRQRTLVMSRAHETHAGGAQSSPSPPLFVSETAMAASPSHSDEKEQTFGMDLVDALSQMSYTRSTPDPIVKRSGTPITPLALFSVCGTMSPGATPRSDVHATTTTPPPSPPHVPNPASPKRVQSPVVAAAPLPRAKSDQQQKSPRKKLFHSTKLQLKKLLPKKNNNNSGAKPGLAMSAERVLSKKNMDLAPISVSERNSTSTTAESDDPSQPRANSAPTSPGRMVVTVNEHTVFDDDNDEPRRPQTARQQRANTICRDSSVFIGVDEDTPFHQFFAALRGDTSATASLSAEHEDESSASGVSESGSYSSADRSDKRRWSMHVKPGTTSSPRFGMRAVFDMDSTTNEPIVRVRSHSSLDELKRRLVAEADAATPLSTNDRRNTSSLGLSIERVDADVRSSSSSSLSATRSGSGSGSANGSESQDDVIASAHSALGRSSKPKRAAPLTLKKKVKYTMIEYNPDPLGLAPWQRFLVPNSEIDTNMRTFLERASRSEEMGEPFRVCQCKVNCTEHLTPDMVAKYAAIFVVEPNRYAPVAVERALALKNLRRGCWAQLYRVQNGNQTNFEKTPCTFHYRYKMHI